MRIVGFPQNGPDFRDNSVVVDDDKCAMFWNIWPMPHTLEWSCGNSWWTKAMFGWHNTFTYQHGSWSSQSFGFSNHSESALPLQWLGRSVLSFWPTSIEQVFHLCSACFFFSSFFISRYSDLFLFRKAFSEIEEEEGRKNHFYFCCSQQQHAAAASKHFL